MFVKADINEVGLSSFQWMPHAMGLVCFGDEPAVVPENLVMAIKKRLDEIAAAGGELFDGLNRGDVVIISEGPFAGYEAIFDARIPGSERVRVLLQLLNNQRQVPLELEAGQVKQMKRPK
jgi:transcriptional antiterminator RfaH